ncbi:hypothetical protein MUG87_01660 [Ectobacillus sp. JY-23]|uniref:hypothetical protein n=1 Tax=Ectobacillus sp. JY-23 TaxID=2933872 RepID=UPI001FF36BD8|nr:hypothetical protein [Ectobacillus sp. JY-23]UOY92876.1 hypothetical protein MUG87_01660 [Ectobacillus sp. JY-23]
MQETPKRKELLKRLSRFRTVPGHGRHISKKTDEELEVFVNLLESMFKRGSSKAKESDTND